MESLVTFEDRLTPVPGLMEIARVPKKFWKFADTTEYLLADNLNRQLPWFAALTLQIQRRFLSVMPSCWMSPNKGSAYQRILARDWHRDKGVVDQIYCILGPVGTEYATIAGTVWQSEPYVVYHSKNNWHRAPSVEDDRVMLRWC